LFVRSNRLLLVNAIDAVLLPLFVVLGWFGTGESLRVAMARLRPPSSTSNPARGTASFMNGTEGVLDPVDLELECISLIWALEFRRCAVVIVLYPSRRRRRRTA